MDAITPKDASSADERDDGIHNNTGGRDSDTGRVINVSNIHSAFGKSRDDAAVKYVCSICLIENNKLTGTRRNLRDHHIIASSFASIYTTHPLT